MRVTYTAPNRAHHYFYAAALARAECLHTFVSGFSRFSPRAALPEAGTRMIRADHWQNLYLASLRLRLSAGISEELAYRSKIWLDRVSEKPAKNSDLFLFYSGAGLRTARRLVPRGVVRVVEAVNSHVLVQEGIMREEHQRLNLPFQSFHRREVKRRLQEYELADAILCPSNFVKESFIQQGFPAARVVVVPYGMSLQDPGRTSIGDSEIFRVLYVGQINIRKGLRYLFEAFSALRHPRKELCIVGPATPQSGIEDRVIPAQTRFLGVLKGEELVRAYRSASVFVLPTLEEGLALVLGEALSFGVPIIATANSGGADLFRDGEEGFLVPIRSPAAMSEKLQLLADDPERRKKMAEAARLRAAGLQGWEKSGSLLVETLDSLVKSRRP